MDLLSLPIDRFCNRVMAWARSRMKESDWAAFESRLEIPPPGVEPHRGVWSEQEMGAAFTEAEQSFG
jgi:hypothetical protein